MTSVVVVKSVVVGGAGVVSVVAGGVCEVDGPWMLPAGVVVVSVLSVWELV